MCCQRIGEFIDTKKWMIDVDVLLGSEVATGVTLSAVTNVRRSLAETIPKIVVLDLDGLS